MQEFSLSDSLANPSKACFFRKRSIVLMGYKGDPERCALDGVYSSFKLTLCIGFVRKADIALELNSALP
jgi:hypothetical protein